MTTTTLPTEAEVLAADGPTLSAMAAVHAMGWVESSINGKPVWLTPQYDEGWTAVDWDPHALLDQCTLVEERVLPDAARYDIIKRLDGLWDVYWDATRRTLVACEQPTEPLARLRCMMLLVARGLAKFQQEAAK